MPPSLTFPPTRPQSCSPPHPSPPFPLPHTPSRHAPTNPSRLSTKPNVCSSSASAWSPYVCSTWPPRGMADSEPAAASGSNGSRGESRSGSSTIQGGVGGEERPDEWFSRVQGSPARQGGPGWGRVSRGGSGWVRVGQGGPEWSGVERGGAEWGRVREPGWCRVTGWANRMVQGCPPTGD